jgi:hypothetical protein
MRPAVWIAGAIVFGWVATVGSGLLLPGGHPPTWYFVGAAVVLASCVMAPVGLIAAVIEVRRARRRGAKAPGVTVAAMALNAVLLAIAVGLFFWIRWEATRLY